MAVSVISVDAKATSFQLCRWLVVTGAVRWCSRQFTIDVMANQFARLRCGFVVRSYYPYAPRSNCISYQYAFDCLKVISISSGFTRFKKERKTVCVQPPLRTLPTVPLPKQRLCTSPHTGPFARHSIAQAEVSASIADVARAWIISKCFPARACLIPSLLINIRLGNACRA